MKKISKTYLGLHLKSKEFSVNYITNALNRLRQIIKDQLEMIKINKLCHLISKLSLISRNKFKIRYSKN